MNDLAGRRLGQYQILEEIGRGGMAVVYKAYQPALERYVAIKVLPQQFTFDREFVARFLREARAAAKLNHPHIVTIHDVGQADSTYYIVMEYLEGPSLVSLLRQRGALPPQQAAQIVAQVASALDHAHRRGFVHRDVKPSNILLSADGAAKLADFGIARAAEGTRLTQTGAIVGTPEYMSPEQAKGLAVDARSDQYSLGVVAYEMLSGRVPFQAESTLALLHKIAYDQPPAIRQMRPELSAGVHSVLTRALAKQPGDRYATASALAEALARALAGKEIGEIAAPPEVAMSSVPPAAPAEVPAMKPAPSRRRIPAWGWVLGVLLVLAVAAGLVGAALIARSGTWSNMGASTPTASPPEFEMTTTPSSTATPTPELTPTAEDTVPPPTPTSPPPTNTPVPPTKPKATKPPPTQPPPTRPRPTATATAESPVSAGPLDFPEPTRLDGWEPTEGGYKATIILRISGGAPPFTIYHDTDMFTTESREYPLVFSVGGCNIIHTITVKSADGQSVSHDYFIRSPSCD